MALDATVGGASSNSYVTQAEADTYFASGMHSKSAVWTALASSDIQDEWLIRASHIIDRQRLLGSKNDTTLDGSGVPSQALHFPRGGDNDAGTAFIPVAIKHATYEQAIFMAERGSGSDTRDQLQSDGVTSVRIGDVSETFSKQTGRLGLLSKEARAILQPFLLSSGNVVF